MKVVRDDSERQVHYEYSTEELLQRLGIEAFTDKEIRQVELVKAMRGTTTFYLVEITVKLSRKPKEEKLA